MCTRSVSPLPSRSLPGNVFPDCSSQHRSLVSGLQRENRPLSWDRSTQGARCARRRNRPEVSLDSARAALAEQGHSRRIGTRRRRPTSSRAGVCDDDERVRTRSLVSAVGRETCPQLGSDDRSMPKLRCDRAMVTTSGPATALADLAAAEPSINRRGSLAQCENPRRRCPALCRQAESAGAGRRGQQSFRTLSIRARPSASRSPRPPMPMRR